MAMMKENQPQLLLTPRQMTGDIVIGDKRKGIVVPNKGMVYDASSLRVEGESTWDWLFTENGLKTVIIDLESTISDVEFLDYCAEIRGGSSAAEVKLITNLGQEGLIKFNEGQQARLEITRPNKEMINRASHEYIVRLAPYAREFVNGLKLLKKEMLIMSQGFENTTGEIGEFLGIPVFAGKLYLDKNGNYNGNEDNGLLAQNNGKNMMVKKMDLKGLLKPKIAAVGDGGSDMGIEYADIKIGCGNCVVREPVREEANIFTLDLSVALVVLAGGPQGWKKLANCRDENIRQAFFDGASKIVFNQVEFNDLSLQLALKSKLQHFFDPRIDLDSVKNIPELLLR